MGGIFQAEDACYSESRGFAGPTGYKCAPSPGCQLFPGHPLPTSWITRKLHVLHGRQRSDTCRRPSVPQNLRTISATSRPLGP